MSQMGFLLDQKYCIGCQTCQAACRARHGLTPGVYPRQATSSQIQAKGPYISLACNHCNKPACVDVCPTGAVQKREEDGLVVHDPEVCIGCYSCESACPYGAPQRNDQNDRMVKCDMCAARLDAGEDPACVAACPVKVLTVGTIEELEQQGGVAEGEGFTVEATEPNIRFIPIA
ncbi:4Fe-4S dicluster domain-containing protein [Xiamenia xianingshaonis]|uniref:4Fe-4S dicluster domain-containing protein n=1 Tax=Xiamenia xianingshaonis TaxID=2682776 RepID=A0A9E6SUR7_9ACTN|nr:4Fe-4S dicluster domain-containing protein [Xiamenia xianingshaonis]NGM18064.1 4Fe-4S dicluster domain-containing protein [Eggerthellaceae bacterium zg-893]NHM14820.1 4Fe-4S dicluster domain-containing protein [Xiamenia xianingshaonis]NHM15498.1 4Fe-4S dicluster domain-containing protein [Xiamenia xianingshaonis]QTU84773.1 4Fe-4S dicluster domain-containing protein [Xiamenia xianingshaonis]